MTTELCNYYLLAFVTAGSGYMVEAGTAHRLRAGEYFLYKPYDEQHYYADAQDPWHIYGVHFNGPSMDTLADVLGLTTSVNKASDPDRLEAAFWRLCHIVADMSPRNYVEANSILMNILLMIANPDTAARNVQQAVHPHVQREIAEVIAYLESHYGENLTLHRIANLAKMSASRFSYLFRLQTGLSPINYLIELRLQKAKELLIHTQFPIKEIADIVGYHNYYHFCNIFKARTGVSPRAYRRSMMC